MINFLLSNRMQSFAIIGSFSLFLFIIELIRRKKLREQYSLIWLFVSFIFMIFALSKNFIQFISMLLGIYYAPSAFLLLLVVGIFLILIQFSVVISNLREENKILAQEIAILKEFAKSSGPDQKESQ